jgi:sulfotransferase
MTTSDEQNYFFLSALPRTGSTLLRTMLNENPDVWATPSTATPEVLRRVQQEAPTYEAVRLDTDLLGLHLSLVRNGLAAMYADRPERYIIDYSRMWGAPYFYNMLRTILGRPPRIVVTVRPLPEIVASFVRKADANPDNFIDREMRERDFWPYHRKPLNDARVDYLFTADSPLQGAMLSLSGAFRDETADSFYIVNYADLVSEPEKTVAGVYDFLGIPRYEHSFEKISANNVQRDTEVLGIPDLHTVRPELEITAPPPETVLSDYGMTRCLIEDFWTGK